MSILKIDNVHPLDGAYPSNNVLALIHLDRSVTAAAADFVKYSLGEEARQVISAFGGVPAPK